jgi:hypothetical protein
MAQGTIYPQDLDPASVDAHTGCEARVSFLAQQLAEVLASTHELRRERNIAREQVRNLRVSLRRALGAV